ncbi:hypothetical protein Tco_1322064, partial [Tanacetum coccineum]
IYYVYSHFAQDLEDFYHEDDEDNTGVLESEVLKDSTCLMLLEDVRGSANLTFLTLFMGVTTTFLVPGVIALGHVS